MKNLLITGGLGYIGSAFLYQLNIEDYDNIVIIDLDLFKTENKIQQVINKNKNGRKVVIKKINFTNITALDRIFSYYKVNIVVHLGGLVGDPACSYNISLTNKINVIATNQIIDLSIKHKVAKFIFASSCSVYGINESICTEKTEPKPISEYAVSKLSGEKKLYSVKDKFEQITIYRFSTLYGVSERVRFDLVANLFYAKAKWENVISLFGGWQWRPFINVKDAGVALSAALSKNKTGLNIYNVGIEKGNSTLENLANLTKLNFPKCKIIDIGSKDDARNYKVNFDKFNNEFGDILNFDLENGINDLFHELKNFQDNWQDLKYSNLLTTIKYSKLLIKNESN